MSSILSPFRWKETPRPSIFAGDTKFTGLGRGAKTQSQISSEAADAYQRKHGRSLGTVHGISEAADKGTAERSFARRRKA